MYEKTRSFCEFNEGRFIVLINGLIEVKSLLLLVCISFLQVNLSSIFIWQYTPSQEPILAPDPLENVKKLFL